ncbi:hypothetical protein [Vulcaniibacterium tengchongense]|uniref:PH (Pleckstrin Homology) domain-containing protein n=1 Tax=Vulcaniibacterium tengchongense TaxID=1273429 RepID=A0A3N4VVL4_9GAMM|nr:hypothetical protein [Vulcaniibacterium tengchongense]RPE77114.1 hypothetical protein EDC50_2372 [Vulcaniibacterium tengchongense]
MEREFPVFPPPPRSWWTLAVLLGLPIAMVAWQIATDPPANGADRTAQAVAALAVSAAIGLCVSGLRRRRVVLRDGVLVVAAAMFTRRVPVADLELERARVVDLEERTELRPSLKSFGMALPGFQAGGFLLRNRRRGFCLLTGGRRALWLPAARQDLLLSLQRPQELLDALRDMAPGRPPG